MLTKRQELTIEHLKNEGIIYPLDIIKYCLGKIDKPRLSKKGRLKGLRRGDSRKHSRQYYQQIIDHLAQQPSKDKSSSNLPHHTDRTNNT